MAVNNQAKQVAKQVRHQYGGSWHMIPPQAREAIIDSAVLHSVLGLDEETLESNSATWLAAAIRQRMEAVKGILENESMPI